MAANKSNITKRLDLDRPLTHAEGDANSQEIINIITDFESHQATQGSTNSSFQTDINNLKTAVGTYEDTTAGLAVTAEGDHFLVTEADTNDSLILYRHDSGPTATQIEVYPSVAGVQTTDLTGNPVDSSTGAAQALGAALDQRGPVFDTVQDMKDAANLYVGGKCRTLGYTSIGDGGGNDYEIVAGGTGGGFRYIDLDSGLQVKQLSEVTSTFLIPTDFATLQEAIDTLATSTSNRGQLIDLVIESGHQPASGISVSNGDYGNFRVSSQDAEVLVAPGFGQATAFLEGSYAVMPALNCLINGNSGELGVGVKAFNNSSCYITPSSGATFCWQNGLLCYYGSNCVADDTVWTNNAVNGINGSGITSWAAVTSAERADVSGSGYYGAQAAHGGILSFLEGVANNTGRYGVRATDGALIDFDGGTAIGNAVYGVHAFNCSRINARNSTATGNVTANINVAGASQVNAIEAIVTGSLGTGVSCVGASTLDIRGGDVSGAAGNGLTVANSTVQAGGANFSNAGANGLSADLGALVNFNNGNSSNCFQNGIEAFNGSTVNANGSTCDDNGQYGALAWYCSVVNGQSGSFRRAASDGVYAFSGSTINVKDANCRKVDGVDTSGSSADILCRQGSIISAHSAIGGVNKTVNTLDSDGIIFG